MPNTSMKVNSSNISEVNYDEKTFTMVVVFNNASAYQYFGVPANVYEDFMTSGSKGRFLATYIKGRFSSSKIQ